MKSLKQKKNNGIKIKNNNVRNKKEKKDEINTSERKGKRKNMT